MVNTRQGGDQPNIAAIIAEQLQNIIPQIVTQVTANVNNAQNANGGVWRIVAVQPTTIQSAVLRAGILTDEAISCGTLSKGSEKRKAEDEGAKSGGSWGDEKKAKVGTGFVATAPPRNEYVNYPVAPVMQCQRMELVPEACYECGSLDHLKPTCPKLNRAPGQAGNQLAIEGNRGSRNNGNQVRGRAYNVNVNAEEASRDPNVVTGTFSLNDCFATILFDSGADFGFISTEFVSIGNVNP
ncbi:hypothetical protein Tco_0754287 [Tanacetum coccineum]